jgi:hypothetical protein
MKHLLLLLLAFYFSMQAQAQVNEPRKIDVGLELDVLPYATGGYFGAGWVGKDVWRIRALTAFVNKPDWSTTKGFSNHQIHAYAAVVDRFLKSDWQGWWAGAGLVLWESTIQTEAKAQTAKFHNFLAHGGLGYSVPMFKHFYVSPWGSLNLRIGGDKNVVVDDKSYTIPLINPEASLKVGYYF